MFWENLAQTSFTACPWVWMEEMVGSSFWSQQAGRWFWMDVYSTEEPAFSLNNVSTVLTLSLTKSPHQSHWQLKTELGFSFRQRPPYGIIRDPRQTSQSNRWGCSTCSELWAFAVFVTGFKKECQKRQMMVSAWNECRATQTYQHVSING